MLYTEAPLIPWYEEGGNTDTNEMTGISIYLYRYK